MPSSPRQQNQQEDQQNEHTNNHENAQNQNEEVQRVQTSQSERKQLRRIAERTEMPTDKAELIQYLSERIKQAEDALVDTEELLQEQVKQREKISKSLDQRNDQLSKLYQVDQRALPDKIKQKLNEILTTTVTQKMDAQDKLQEQKLKNYQYKAIYSELKWEDKNSKVKIEQQQKKQLELSSDLEGLNALNEEYQREIKASKDQYEKIKKQKEEIENKYFQLKVALERMGDVKAVLNRFFGNEDLFNQKMDMKQQKIQRLPQPAKESPLLPPSRDNKSAKPLNNNPKLKPISKGSKNGDEDFWKMDVKDKTHAY